jgi:hypothetical protein
MTAHPSFMPQEALQHADAVVIGEVELVIDKLLDDLKQGTMRGTYKSEKLHPMAGLEMPRYDLLKKSRYVNRTFVQTSRGCHQGCTFCAEPLMNGLKFRYHPVDEAIHEMENCGATEGADRRCLYYFLMAVIVIRYETTATARWASPFIVRAFFNDTITVAVWTGFHVRLKRMLPHPFNCGPSRNRRMQAVPIGSYSLEARPHLVEPCPGDRPAELALSGRSALRT